MILPGCNRIHTWIVTFLVLPTEKIFLQCPPSSGFDSEQHLQIAILAWATNRNTNFRFLTEQNPDPANPISYIFLCPSIVFVALAQFIMNPNPSFIVSKPNTCLASQITRNWVWWWWSWLESIQEDAPICQMLMYCVRIVCRLSMNASIVTPTLEIWGDAYQLKHQLINVLELDIRPIHWTPTDNTQLLKWRHLRRCTRPTGTDCIGQADAYILGGFAPEKIGLADVLDIY